MVMTVEEVEQLRMRLVRLSASLAQLAERVMAVSSEIDAHAALASPAPLPVQPFPAPEYPIPQGAQ